MRAPAAEHSDEYWDKVLTINLDSPFILAREIGKHMLQRGSGKIIFTCSLLTFQGGINVPGYTASKSAIGGLVKALANEWAGKGVNVNAIAPGATDTPFLRTHLAKVNDDVDAAVARIVSGMPLGRLISPEDFADAAVFLASPAARSITGHTLLLDGGATAGSM